MGAMKNLSIEAMNEEQDRKRFEENAVVPGTLYTIAELRSWFDSVADQTNWKLPVEKTLTGMTPTKRREIYAAIEYFTGSKAEWTRLHGYTWTVRAEGYYAAVGA